MEAASPPEAYIYQGVWTNWLKGGIWGCTLTVDSNNGAILSPALALIISIAGSQLWRLFQYALHQSRVTDKEKNFLYHQQQITLRNTATDLNTLWRLIRLAFAWRRHADVRVLWDSLPLLLWTSFHLTLVILAGLFSSWLLHAGDQVLSRSPHCGDFTEAQLDAIYHGNWSTSQAISTSFEYESYRNSRFAMVQQHVDICDMSPDTCNTPFTTKLPNQATLVPGACPFGSSICHPNSDMIQFDTGFMSSANHLGFNAAAQDRVSLRMTAKCAPLDDASYVTGWKLVDQTSEMPAHQVSAAYYGPGNRNTRNATFSYTEQFMECEQKAVLLPYVLSSQWYRPGGSVAKGTSTFDPIPELQLTDADTSLIMLMSNSRYDNPVLDPWFTAQLAVNNVNTYCLSENKTVYSRQTPITTMACTQQWQICNTDSLSEITSARCTQPQGRAQLSSTFNKAKALTASYNAQQLATVDRLLLAGMGSSFYYIVHALAQTNGAPIKARNLITGTQGIAVPDTQWHTETTYWMDIVLAYFRQNLMDFSTGQFSSKIKYINATTPDMDVTGSAYQLCQNQIIDNTSFRNFNFSALVICVTVCAIITILGLTIEDMIGYIRQHRLHNPKHHDKKDMWIVNSDLEMLRTVIELKKKIQWGRSSFGIPFASIGAKADIRDLRSDVLEARAGRGIVNRHVERRQTAASQAYSGRHRRARSQGHPRTHIHALQHANRSCTTCESFEMLPTPTRSDDSLSTMDASPLQTPGQNTGTQSHPFYFTNDIPVQPAQATQPGIPLLQVTDDAPITQLQDTQTQTQMPIPQSTTDPNDPVTFSLPPPLANDVQTTNRRNGVDVDGDASRSGSRGSGLWAWPRRSRRDGTIC